MAPRKRTAAERFWPKVDKNGPVPPHCPEIGECWLWTGAITDVGYGFFSYETSRPMRRQMGAHRAAWTLTFGDIPDDLFCCHKCDRPECVRPSHLFLYGISKTQASAVRSGKSWRHIEP